MGVFLANPVFKGWIERTSLLYGTTETLSSSELEHCLTIAKEPLLIGLMSRVLIYKRDFYALSSCRDLLFHVQETCFTINRIQAFLSKHNLELIGFESDAPEVFSLYTPANSNASQLRSLEYWNQLEQSKPHIFGGMYQFWIRSPLENH